MAALIDSNLYLRNPAAQRRWLKHNALESSVFEGARGLTAGARQRRAARNRRSIASRKNRVSAS
jgi:hypothetical protein